MRQTKKERFLNDDKYANSKRGFIVLKISNIFKPSNSKLKKNRRSFLET